MKRMLLFLLLLSATSMAIHTYAQTENGLWKGHFYNKENGIDLRLDLYEKTLQAPGLSFLGEMNGYMSGRIYGIWMLVSYQIKGNVATLRFSNDQGADSQTITFTATSDSTYIYNATGGNNIKRVVGKKLVKIPETLHFSRKP